MTHRPSQAHKATDYDMATKGNSDLGELAKTVKVLKNDVNDCKPQNEELKEGTQDLETTITQLHEQFQIIAQAQDEFSRRLQRLYADLDARRWYLKWPRAILGRACLWLAMPNQSCETER
ncbi:hypothetical protein LTR22_011762 [Elasticomyces elasticus]|nr:hypothetical protein LTR22_011762 [Elasticomyces elasticus]KAK4909952.1 hypothetical protein LTR49_021358 [Elasticomyces elasticus]